jgi:hypothetical protein
LKFFEKSLDGWGATGIVRPPLFSSVVGMVFGCLARGGREGELNLSFFENFFVRLYGTPYSKKTKTFTLVSALLSGLAMEVVEDTSKTQQRVH